MRADADGAPACPQSEKTVLPRRNLFFIIAERTGGSNCQPRGSAAYFAPFGPAGLGCDAKKRALASQDPLLRAGRSGAPFGC